MLCSQRKQSSSAAKSVVLPESNDVTVLSLDLREKHRLRQLGFLVSTSGQAGGLLDEYFCQLMLSHKLTRNASLYM